MLKETFSYPADRAKWLAVDYYNQHIPEGLEKLNFEDVHIMYFSTLPKGWKTIISPSTESAKGILFSVSYDEIKKVVQIATFLQINISADIDF